MNLERIRKNQKKAISPVIATIILIAVALVLALVVGVFAFGLFASNTHNISLQSSTLTSGATAVLQFSLKNPSGATPSVTGVTLDNSAGAVTCTVPAGGFPIALTGNAATAFTCAPANPVTQGSTYTMVITLDNGQALTASLVAI